MDTFPSTTKAALLGQGVGDAFGAPFEYHKDAGSLAGQSVRERRYLDSREDVGSAIKRSRLPGLYTDDTQQALAMLWVWRQLVLKGRDPTDPELFAPVLRKVFGRMSASRVGPFGVHRGTGGNFRAAIQHGTPVDTAGMGAAMRIGPVTTLWPADRPLDLIPWVRRVSEVTTTNGLAQDAAALYAAHIWKAAHGWTAGPEVYAMYMNVEGTGETWDLLHQALDVLTWRGEGALLKHAEDTGLSNKKMRCAANGFALTGIPWVLDCARRTASSHFASALSETCRSGGDTDTVAAMVGCLLAVNDLNLPGRLRVPDWMAEGLKGRDHIENPERWHPVGSEEPLTKADQDYRRSLRVQKTKAEEAPEDLPF
jgi:ADP-ribosylglycohydrolase